MSEEKDIPKHWRVKKLGEVCKLKNGYAFKSDHYESIGVPVIRISDINEGIVSSGKAVRVKPIDEYENYLVENNDILVAMSGATTGKFGVYKSTEKAYQNQRVGKFRILDENILNNEFLYHQINSLKRQIEKDAYGGAQPNISSAKIEQMQIVLPPLPEQQAIVAKIEELLSDLENGKQQLQTAQQQLKVYRQSLLKWAFEGKLTNKNVKEGELPKGWKWVKLGEVLDFVGSGVTPKGGQSVYKTSGVVFLRSQNVYPNKLELDDVAFITDEIDERMKRTRVKPNYVLLNITGASIGRSAFVPPNLSRANVNQHVCILRANQQLLDCAFLSSYLNSPQAQSEIMNTQSGATRQGLNFQQIRNIEIPFPPIKGQQLIVDELESKLTVCDKIEETISHSLQQAETLRQSILKKAFEGKLVTQNPNDEPASKLLGRIKAESAKSEVKKKNPEGMT